MDSLPVRVALLGAIIPKGIASFGTHHYKGFELLAVHA